MSSTLSANVVDLFSDVVREPSPLPPVGIESSAVVIKSPTVISSVSVWPTVYRKEDSEPSEVGIVSL